MLKKILLVEDDHDTSVLLQRILRKAGFEVDLLKEGKAIVSGEFDLPDLFILDNRLPTIEGIAICKFLRLKPYTRDIPVIIISGLDHLAERSNLAGANYFLPKPLDPKELLEAIENLLDNPVVPQTDASNK